MSGGMSGESYMESDFYNDSAYTQVLLFKDATMHSGVLGAGF
jgi:hypothetical protein